MRMKPLDKTNNALISRRKRMYENQTSTSPDPSSAAHSESVEMKTTF